MMGWVTRLVEFGEERWFGTPLPVSAPTPANYDATLPNLGLATMLMPLPTVITPLLGTETLGQFPLGTPARDPTIGTFIRDAGLVPGTVGEVGMARYIPPDTPDGRLGRFVVGKSPIGWRRSSHGPVTVPPPPSGDVEE